jgi:hypothetical protein
MGVIVAYPYNLTGGYLVMLILGAILWKTWSRG